jgi:hypothetical protein
MGKNLNPEESRPKLDKTISLEDFEDFYWPKQELISFCAKEGLKTSGGKTELAERIQHYLKSGEIITTSQDKKKSDSRFDWTRDHLSADTMITDSYKNSANVRAFFTEYIGTHFAFNVKFMKWMRDHEGRTLAEAAEEWNRIHEMSKDKDYQTEIAPQFEYNRYIRDFLADNPSLKLQDAIRFWNLKRQKRGSKAYQKSDLDFHS